MSVAGSCEICLTGRVGHSCDRCGNLVCAEHFDDEIGYCSECAAELGRRRTNTGEKPGEDGTGTYRF